MITYTRSVPKLAKGTPTKRTDMKLFNVRLHKDAEDRVRQYAEEHGISFAGAVRDFIDMGSEWLNDD